MKYLTKIVVAATMAALLPSFQSQAAEEPTPIFSATAKSYEEVQKMVGTITKTVAPGEGNPMLALDLMFGESFNREKPIHFSIWLNGILQPLVATYIPTDDFGELKKKLLSLPGRPKDIKIEKLDGYLLILNGSKESAEDNLLAARSIDTAEFGADYPLEMKSQIDDSTRTLLKGALAAGRLGMMQERNNLGDMPEAKMMMDMAEMGLDIAEGFIDGMESTTMALGIVDDGIRLSTKVTAKEGSTFSKLIAKTPMDPAPLVDCYIADKIFGMSIRVSSLDESLEEMMVKMMGTAMTMGTSGDISEDDIKEMIGLTKKMVPVYTSMAYHYNHQLETYGLYHLPKDGAAADFYAETIKLSKKMGKSMAGEGKPYSKFKHEKGTRDDAEIDKFSYEMGEDFPPNPIFDGQMDIEYHQSGKDILFGMGKNGVGPLLGEREPVEMPEFLVPNENTTMIGHFDVVALAELFAKIEISHNPEDLKFIADSPKWNKVMMKSAIDGAFHFDLHVPLATIKTLSRMR